MQKDHRLTLAAEVMMVMMMVLVVSVIRFCFCKGKFFDSLSLIYYS